ncbi:MAG: MFS transporter [Clostridiales bacterium]|nr:MFS transporter [Clostridiales bacterium]
MIKGDNAFLKFMRLFALGYMGGTIYLLMYVRYCFYDQMQAALDCTNAQLGLLNTACTIAGLPFFIHGPMWADRFDAKRILTLSIGGMTLVTFIYGFFATSYTASMICWIAQACVMCSYWSCLIKYINNLGGEDEAGNSFGIYYLINGLSGAFGNAFPLWVVTKFNLGYAGVIFVYGGITLVGTILVILFLEDEKQLAAKGISLKGDEPVNIKHIPYVIKWPGTWIICFAYLTTYTIYTNVSYFNPYLTDVVGIDEGLSSFYSVIRSYACMVIAPVGGIMADKVFKSTSTWYIVAFAITAVMWIIPLFFGPETNATFVCIYSLLPSLVIFALYSVTYSILRELHINPMVAGTAIGIGSFFPGFIVDGVWPTLFGTWLDKFGNQGYTYIFIFLAADCAVGILVALWAKRLDKQCQNGRTMDLSKLKKAE